MPKAQIEIKNGDNNDNFVTVQDRNLAGMPTVWNGKRLNGGASDWCSLEVDGGGDTRMNWTATRSDDPAQTRTETDVVGIPGGQPVFITCS